MCKAFDVNRFYPTPLTQLASCATRAFCWLATYGARRGALPGGDARHMLLQDSLLGALAVQVIWGLCWVASRTLGTLDQR